MSCKQDIDSKDDQNYHIADRYSSQACSCTGLCAPISTADAATVTATPTSAVEGSADATARTANFSTGTKKGIALARLAEMLHYPDRSLMSEIPALCTDVIAAYPGTARELRKFQKDVEKTPLSELEELYTRTFDLAAIVSPYVTGYIYGDENFDRGTFMAVLGEEYAKSGFDSKGELPDHLAVLLSYCECLDNETLNELVHFCLLKPVGAMVESLKAAGNVYYSLVAAIFAVLRSEDTGECCDG